VFGEVPLFVVDHNRNQEELRFLKNQNIIVLQNKGNLTHGDGLDIAVKHAKHEGYDAIVFIEPDCVFSGTQWQEHLIKSLESGKSMASVFRWSYGPLHPCGSAWMLNDIPGSFIHCKKLESEVFHSRYLELMNLYNLCSDMVKQYYSNELFSFFLYNWDVGIRNWFHLATVDKTQLVKADGFCHFWGSHARPPNVLMNSEAWTKNIIQHWIDKTKNSKMFL